MSSCENQQNQDVGKVEENALRIECRDCESFLCGALVRIDSEKKGSRMIFLKLEKQVSARKFKASFIRTQKDR